ncbi:MAG: SUMF1/EgtB/PvdO family nonheme iron enzyme, partial [Rhodopirellula sp.]|nr:SUMF1/EgtB/PvdO family nonheme iron enzyme [Rhodopirellula sp.]
VKRSLENKTATSTTGQSSERPKTAPPPAVAPFNAAAAKQHQKAWAEHLGLPVEKEVELPGGAKIAFMLIPPGEFLMGSTQEERDRMLKSLGAKEGYINIEGPQHSVRITQPYYLARFETTQAQWQAVMEANPAKFPGPNRPVEQVSWDDIQPFLKKLNASTERVGAEIILPTEAQWEHACRAGTTTSYWFGDDDTAIAKYEWNLEPDQRDTSQMDVGQLKPNPWGLYDMLGNVREWCADAGGRYQDIPATDPLNTTNALNARIRRGGGRVLHAWQCRSASRGEAPSRESDGWVGFRLAMTIDSATLKSAQTLPGEGDRALAEWLLTNRENVNLMIGSTGARTFADTAAALPEGPIDLSGITLRGQQTVTVELLKRFAEAEHVESLNFQCDDELLARITELFPNLISLYTHGEQVTGAGLANLRPLRRLKRLSLHDCPNIGNDDLQHLAALKSMNALGIDNTPIDDRGLTHLKALSNLDFLELRRTNVAGPGLENLKKLGQLYLSDCGNIDDTSLQSIARLSSLKLVDLNGTRVTSAGVAELQKALPDCEIEWDGVKTSAVPPPSIAPFDEAQAKAHQEAWANHIGTQVETVNSVGMRLVVIPPGKFRMGEGDVTVDVTLTNPFRFGVHEVTQGQWKAVMGGSEPWKGQQGVIEGDNVAATYVSWPDAVAFCGRLTDRERAAGKLRDGWEYRLPTEAEWEYACRAGTTTPYSFGDESLLGEYAWYDANTKDAGEAYAHTVGLKKPNPWGLYDIHGNAREWCFDWRGDALPGGTDPPGPTEGSYRVDRGGSWSGPAEYCRSARRFGGDPSHRYFILGFRVALSPIRDDARKATDASTTASAPLSRDTIIPADGWVDVRTLIDPAADSTTENGFVNPAVIDQGVLVLGHRTRLTLPLMVHGSFQLRAEFTVFNGPKYLNLEFPVATSQPQLFLAEGDNQDGFVGAGLSTIDGRPARDPLNPTHTKDQLLVHDQKQTLNLMVSTIDSKATINATIDGKPFVDWTGAATSLPAQSQPERRQITIAIYKGMLRLHSIELKMLDGEAKLLRPADAAITKREAATTDR